MDVKPGTKIKVNWMLDERKGTVRSVQMAALVQFDGDDEDDLYWYSPDELKPQDDEGGA